MIGGTLRGETAETLGVGRQLHAAGDLAGADRIYRRLAAADPDQADVWYLLGRARHSGNDTSEAIACYRKALALRPAFGEALNNLGIALNALGHRAEAVAAYREAVRLLPGYVEGHNNLGNALNATGHRAEAAGCLREAIRLRADFAAAHNNLGVVLKGLRDWPEAASCFARAAGIDPEFAEAHVNLAIVLGELREDDRALAAYRRALAIKPDLVAAFAGIGRLFEARGRLDEAEAITREGLRRQPEAAELWGNLGFLLAEQGLLPEGLRAYRKGIEIRPESPSSWGNYLYHLNYDPTVDAETLLREHRRGSRTLAGTSSPRQVDARDRALGRPLRVGYISPDFRLHAVASFLEPILAHHDPERVEAYCYSDVGTPDSTTNRLRALARAWREIRLLDDDAVEALIREDQVDILVDLAGHTARNRLGVLARKPAPVQVTYLGYPGTTGLSTIDAIVTDGFLDPIGRPPTSTERPLRLPSTFCCFAPPVGAGGVSPSPMLRNGFPTFGSLHKLPKLNPKVIDLWATLLRAVPSSRLLLVRDSLGGRRRRELLGQFEGLGIEPGRVRIESDWSPANHWATYAAIDLSLDVFPWSGHTTACESLWMGVPVVTLAGDRRSSRMTASVLASLGLDDLIAETAGQYVEIAARWARDPARLSDWRRESRGRLLNSRLLDGSTFTRALEDAFEGLWAQAYGGIDGHLDRITEPTYP